MRHGLGGVASVALRYYAVTADVRYRNFAWLTAHTVASRYTNKLWQDWGLEGFGELLLDSYTFLRDDRFLGLARYVAEGITPYLLKRVGGVAIPGNDLMKISCDFGLGSAGISMFLQRLRNPKQDLFCS